MKNLNIKSKKPDTGDAKSHKVESGKSLEGGRKVGINNKNIGRMGENSACYYLKSKGHLILGRNIRLGRGEIDILTKKDGTLHLVEVKTNTFDSPIQAEESITNIKKKKLTVLANRVLSQYGSNASLFGQIESDSKTEAGMLLRDSPSIQIGAVIVRLKISKSRVERVVVKYYPNIY